MNKKIETKIDTFLNDKRKSIRGAWATVLDRDLNDLCDIIELLIDEKFQGDADGDRPVRYRLYDRTQVEANHFFDIPHTHKTNNSEDMVEAISFATTNVKMAADKLDTLMKIFEDRKRREKKLEKVKE